MFLFFSKRICFLIYVLCSLNLISAEINQDGTEFMCADEKCSVPISLSTATKKYLPDSNKKISVKIGDKVQILGKPADSSDDYYYVKSLVSNKKGLLKKDFIRETQIYYWNPNLMKVQLTKKSVKSKTPDISPSAPTNVYDGTTIIESYEDVHYPYEPTQAQGQLNDAGSPSVVQSTTPPTVIGDDSPLSVTSAEIESRNATEGDQESKGISSEPSTSSDIPAVPGTTPGDQMLDLDGIGISSTPASTIYNEPSQSHDIPNDANIVSATTEIPVSPGPAQIDKSQTHENVNAFQEATNIVGNGIGAEEVHMQSNSKKEGETVLGNFANQLKLYLHIGNDGSTEELENQKSVYQQDDSTVSIPGEHQPSVKSDVEQVELDADIKNDTESIQATSQDTRSVDQQVISEQPVEQQVISEQPVEQQVISEQPVEQQVISEQPVGQQVVSEQPVISEQPVGQQEISEQPVGQQVIPEKPVDDQLTSTVSTDDDDVAALLSDISVEQSSENDDLDAILSEVIGPDLHKDLSDSDVGVQLTTGSVPISSALNLTNVDLLNGVPAPGESVHSVGAGDTSDHQSISLQNVVAEQEKSFQDVSNPVDHQLSDIQSSGQNKTMIIESEGSPLEKLTSDAGSTDAFSSQNNHVRYERLPTQPALSESSAVDPDLEIEISADSEEDDSNINFESSKSEVHSGSNDPVETVVRTENETNGTEDSIKATGEQSDSVSTTNENIETRKVVEEPAPPSSAFPFSSNIDFVDPRLSDPAISSSSPSVGVPAVAEEPIIVPVPTNIPPSTHSDVSIPQVDVDTTTPPPPPEPSHQPESEPSQIVDANVEIQENSFEEPPSLIEEDSSNPWYSGIFSYFDSIQGLFSSNAPESEEIPSGADTPEVTAQFQDEKSETCSTDSCDLQPQVNSGIENYESYLTNDYVWLSPRGMILMIVTAIAVLLFSLGHYYLENLKRDVELVSKYNDLAGKLFIEQKEKEMLAEQLTSVNESMTQISFDTTKYDEEISDLKALVQKYKEEKSTVEEKEKETRKKFMMVDKNYNELRNILSQNKQKGERSALILDIKNLKESIAGNNIEIASLKEQLLEKKEEIKSLNARIMEFMEANKQLEKNVEKAISENHETAQKYQNNIAKLEKTIEESTVARVKLEKECTQLKKEKESLAIEKELAESSLQKFQRLKPSNALTEWLDAKEVRVSLLTAEKKIEELTIIRDDLTREKNLVEEKERTLFVDFEQLNEKYEKAEKEKIEALTKLQVLSDYFKEKETQLQEELGTKESLWLQKQSDDRTIYEQMRALREENASFKNQNETLKREILDQEASFKKLITSAEEKAHENWVALRHHERRLKEAQMEASQLRSRLTTLESTGDNSDDKMNKGEVNGDIPPYGSATSPPFMLYPEFVPPPPLLPTTPSRPPPLGRISSPPLGDFTPPPPLVPYEMFLPPSPPPPAPHVLHKPQPLDGSHRIQKDSQSSNHSSESAPDRPRRNKR